MAREIAHQWFRNAVTPREWIDVWLNEGFATKEQAMNIAILGTGPVAQTLGGALAGRGHTVTLGSRRPEAVDDSAVPVAGHAAAIEPADLVINAIAGSQALDAITAIGADVLAGKVLLDLGNAVTPAFELVFPNASLGGRLQEALPDTAVVKSLNTLAAPLWSNPPSCRRAPSSCPATTTRPRTSCEACSGTSGGRGVGDRPRRHRVRPGA